MLTVIITLQRSNANYNNNFAGMLEPDMSNWGILVSIPFFFLASFSKLTASEMRTKMISREIDELVGCHGDCCHGDCCHGDVLSW